MDDDRAEQAFRSALNEHADEPDFQPLQLTPAKPRARLRWVPAAAVLAIVAAFAIPAMLNRTGVASEGSAAAPMQATPADRASPDSVPTGRPGWRWESYRMLTYQVPASWGYGWAPGSDWCAAGGNATPTGPFVDVAPETRAVRAILCPRDIPPDRLAMFVSVHRADAPNRGWAVPSGWAVASAELSGYTIEVVHPASQRELARQIVATVRPLPQVDGNGCPAASPFGGSAIPSAQPSLPGLSRASLCQYDLTSTPALLATKSLEAIPAAQLRSILESAPNGSGPDDTSCSSTGDTAVLVRFWSADDQVRDVLVRYSGCGGNGIVTGTTSRELTTEACRAVMAPPITFTSGSGKAGTMCAPAPTPTPSKTR